MAEPRTQSGARAPVFHDGGLEGEGGNSGNVPPMPPPPGPSVAAVPPSGAERGGADGAPAAPTILVVDDERNIRRTLDLVLRGEGYEVVEAPSAEQAIALLEGGEGPVDLAI